MSPILRGGEPARQISLSVAGEEELYLYVLGAPDVIGGAVDWADARLIDKDGQETFLCELKSVQVLEGRHSPHVTLESGVSGPLKMRGKEYRHGIQAYAYSKIRVPLGGRYERFEATVGIDDWVGKRGAVRCLVTNGRGAARQDLWMLLAPRLPRRPVVAADALGARGPHPRRRLGRRRLGRAGRALCQSLPRRRDQGRGHGTGQQGPRRGRPGESPQPLRSIPRRRTTRSPGRNGSTLRPCAWPLPT